jgi:hypothetical protein
VPVVRPASIRAGYVVTTRCHAASAAASDKEQDVQPTTFLLAWKVVAVFAGVKFRYG